MSPWKERLLKKKKKSILSINNMDAKVCYTSLRGHCFFFLKASLPVVLSHCEGLLSNSSYTEKNAEVWDFPQITVSSFRGATVRSQALRDVIIPFFKVSELSSKAVFPNRIWSWINSEIVEHYPLSNLFLKARLAAYHHRIELKEQNRIERTKRPP